MRVVMWRPGIAFDLPLVQKGLRCLQLVNAQQHLRWNSPATGPDAYNVLALQILFLRTTVWHVDGMAVELRSLWPCAGAASGPMHANLWSGIVPRPCTQPDCVCQMQCCSPDDG